MSGNADFVKGWRACAAWIDRMIRHAEWDVLTRKRLKALVWLADSVQPALKRKPGRKER